MGSLKISALLAAVVLVAPCAAQLVIGTFTRHGTGCPGSNPLLGCTSVNTHAAISAGNAYAAIPFAALIPGGGFRVIQSIDFWGQTRTATSSGPGGTYKVPVSIYSSVSGLPGTQLRTASITFNGTLRLLRLTVNPVLPQLKGQDLFLVFDLTNTALSGTQMSGVVLPVGKSGATVSTYYTQGGNWQRAGWDHYWMYNVNCVQNGTPELTCNYGPNINRPFDFFLRGAPTNRMALLATGLQSVNLDLGPAGAPGCMLLVAPLLLTSAPTDGSGYLRVQSGVPNMKGLLNASFRIQFAIRDTTNPLGLVFSNALVANIGNSL